jgi:hypothetical protein
MTQRFAGKAFAALLAGLIALASAATHAATSTRYTNSGIAEGSYVTMKSVNTHVCIVTGLQARYSAADEEQIKRVDDQWRLYGGTFTEATCFAHTDFYDQTGGARSSRFFNGTSWVRAVAKPSNSCQSYVNIDTGDATGIVYIRGFNGEFEDPAANPLPWNSYVAVTQATQLYVPNTYPLVQTAKSNIKVRVDACTAEFYILGGLGAWLPVGDFTQRARLSAGWFKAGDSRQMAKFATENGDRVYASDSKSEFRVSATNFETRELKMAPKDKAACYLTYFGGRGGSITTRVKDGHWTLIAKSNSLSNGPRISGRARCYAYDQSDIPVPYDPDTDQSPS